MTGVLSNYSKMDPCSRGGIALTGKKKRTGVVAGRLGIMVLVVLLWVGCAQTQLVLRGSGLSDDEKAIRVTSRTTLSIIFGTDRFDSTKVRSGDGYVVAPVNVVESDGVHLLVKSDRWLSVADVPDSYLKNRDVHVTARHQKYDRPTLSIPLSSVQELTIIRKHFGSPAVLTRLTSVPRWIWQGASVGFGVVLAAFMPETPTEFYRIGKYDISADDVLVAATIGAIGGATLNTFFRLVWPTTETEYKSYDIRRGHWRIHGNR